MSFSVSRIPIRISPEPNRVLLRAHMPDDESRLAHILERALAVPEAEVGPLVERLLQDFASRHRDLRVRLLARCAKLGAKLPAKLSEPRRLLVGAAFSMEYSLEAAALFNPSMVWHPEQSGLPAGWRRFILALRATGEGHISSLVFRSGVADDQGGIRLDPVVPLVTGAGVELRDGDVYEAVFAPELPLGERVLFPCVKTESKGIEDVRLVRFDEEDGRVRYLGTYTAYDGHDIRPRMLETGDFLHFRSAPLVGSEALNKGFAYFPRRIGGRYAMLSRQDNESNFLMFSDTLERWEHKQQLLAPRYPWELVQLGNCGSPLETEAGWLVIGHAVGPLRRYVLSAFLLDREDPARVIGRLREPLLFPTGEEREGYVPNVLYTCGALVHDHRLLLPYAMSDRATCFATVELPALLEELTAKR